MNRFVLYFAILILIIGCSDRTQQETPIIHIQPEIKKTSTKDTVQKTASFIRKTGLFWGHYKSLNRRLLNCGKTIPYTWENLTIPGFKYSYCQFNGAAAKESHKDELGQSAVILQFQVWIKGKKTGLYSDSLNETLTAIICRCNDPGLKGMDLINTDLNEIIHEFGKPDSSSATKLFYKTNDEILCIRLAAKKTTSFYWLKLNDEKQSFSSIDKTIPELSD